MTGQIQGSPKTYTIDVTTPGKTIESGKLQSGGKNDKNESIEVNNFYILINGKPFIPVTGEKGLPLIRI